MDLLKTILVYMSMVFAVSVQTAPSPGELPDYTAPTPTPYVQAAVTSSPTPAPTPSATPVPTINITPNPEYRTIQVGDNGDAVLQLQQKLAEYGYYAGELDGRFGNQTRRAVEAFQYQHGLGVDGIAGRNTLTVLYESNEVRMSPDSATPSPEPQSTGTLIAAAVTAPPNAETTAPTTGEPSTEPEQVLNASFAPVETVAPTQTATPTETLVPTQTPEPVFMPIDNGTIRLSSGEDALTRELEGEEETAALVPYAYGEELYLPLLEILRAAGYNVISTTSVEMDEYAFAVGSDIMRITHTETREGEPTNLQVYRNNEPQIVPVCDVRGVDGIIYLPASTIESVTGLTAVLDAQTGIVIVTFPQKEE